MDRYLRQVMLVEIGERGQARIASAKAHVGGEGLAHDIAARYAERAGFAGIEPGAIDIDASAPRDIVKNEEARATLAGCRAALAEVRRALRDEGDERDEADEVGS